MFGSEAKSTASSTAAGCSRDGRAHLGAKLALGEGATQLIFRALIAVVGLEILSLATRAAANLMSGLL